MYIAEDHRGSRPKTIRRVVEGLERPMEGGDPYASAFAGVVLNQGDGVSRGNPWLPLIDVLFESRDEVVQFCKDHVAKLVVQHDAAGGARLDHGRAVQSDDGSATILSLVAAVTPSRGSSSGDEVDGIVGMESRLWVPEPIDAQLAGELADDLSDIRRLTTWPIERSFAYVDISDFSKYRPGQQALMAAAFAGIVRFTEFWMSDPLAERAWRDLEAMLCVGDGYIYVFRSAMHATYFAAHLASVLEMLVARSLIPLEIHFRMGVHVGPVYCFWDPGRNNWNYIGEGINGGQRVISVIGRDTDDVLFISSRVRQALLAASDTEPAARVLLANAQNKGRRHDKQGTAWRVYEVNHTNIMSDHLRSLKWLDSES